MSQRGRGLSLLDTGTDSRGQEERNIGNVAQEVIGLGREGEFSFPGSTLLVLVSRGKKILLYLQMGREDSTGRKNKDDDKGKPGVSPCLIQGVASGSASMKSKLAVWVGDFHIPSQLLEKG